MEMGNLDNPKPTKKLCVPIGLFLITLNLSIEGTKFHVADAVYHLIG